MSKSEFAGGAWPPRGWKKLNEISKLSGQAIIKDPQSAQVNGLSFKIEPLPVYKNNTRTHIYSFQIDGWEYSINNDSREFPVLHFLLKEKDAVGLSNSILSDIKAYARPVRVTPRSSQRTLMAALLMIKQIINGQVPDAERTLKLYKIHPSQRSLYEIDNNDERTSANGPLKSVSYFLEKNSRSDIL
jgi:hypothetical protein